MKKTLILLIVFLLPLITFAGDLQTENVFKAEVVEIIDKKNEVNEKGKEIIQQNIRLKGLGDVRKGEEFIFYGITEFELIGGNVYKEGDKVLLLESFDAENVPQYYILDYVRTNYIVALFFLFIFVLLLVGKRKAFRSLISLFLTFFIIFYYIVPKIIDGANPLIVTLVGSILILIALIYITEGFRPLSHISTISIAISLFISVFLSWFFVLAANLSGVFSEEIASLANIGSATINFQGLLLAGIIIGLLGVLDDVVISQVSTVEQLHLSDRMQSKKELISKSFKVGISHISSMTNTLFLAYAGVSLPLLVLLVSGESSFLSLFDVINNQQIATEIVRTLAGSIGLVLSIPISTLLAVYWFKKIS